MSIPAALIQRPGLVRAAMYSRFIDAYGQQGAAILPEGTREVPQTLVDAAFWILSHSPNAKLRPGVIKRVRAWALDLRRVGFPSAEFPAVANMLADASAADSQSREILVAVAETMRTAVEEADLAGIPAASAAQITEVAPAGGTDSGVTIVQLEAGIQVDYAPGQVLPVMQVGRQGVWRGLAPALPSNSFGQLEFHVDGEIEPEAGTYLTLGAARGPSPVLDCEQAMIAAVGTGWAAAKAMLFGILERETRPDVHLLIGADTTDELYDLRTIGALNQAHDWLTVTCAVTDGEDAGPAQEAGLNHVWAPLSAFLAGAGTWWGREVVLCGTKARTDELVRSLHAAGAERAQNGITVVAHDAQFDWTTPPDEG
ncbi:FMN reductase [Corynebacterium glaucum]|uniref:hypothetical protein n=1 Tax=Corynebacterium glaucum TaxID=187491 RepID=UPI0025B45A4F|nr:hypothetical protein [Corynebacterium glaucum]WJZ08643.1 FMN reductase [Corynebacterium glaucum]